MRRRMHIPYLEGKWLEIGRGRDKFFVCVMKTALDENSLLF